MYLVYINSIDSKSTWTCTECALLLNRPHRHRERIGNLWCLRLVLVNKYTYCGYMILKSLNLCYLLINLIKYTVYEFYWTFQLISVINQKIILHIGAFLKDKGHMTGENSHNNRKKWFTFSIKIVKIKETNINTPPRKKKRKEKEPRNQNGIDQICNSIVI